MKRMWLISLALCLSMNMSAFASSNYHLDELSVDELLELQDAVSEELEKRTPTEAAADTDLKLFGKDEATKENPADPFEESTIVFEEGTYTFRLKNLYVGDEAFDKICEIGEDDYYRDEFYGMKYMLLEFEVHAIDVNVGSFYPSLMGNDLWDTEYMSIYDYYYLDLRANAGRDGVNVSLRKGESADPVYMLYAIPEDVTVFRNGLFSLGYDDRDYWFEYRLE